MCLEEMHGLKIPEGALFYGETRRRERVEVTQKLRQKVDSLSLCMHDLFERGVTPPAERNSKCRRCSLANECMPEAGCVDARGYWVRHGEDLELT